MNKLLVLGILVVLLAILRAAVLALVVTLLLALLVAAVLRPGHTLVFVGCVGMLSLASAQPVACIIALGVVAVVSRAVMTSSKACPPTYLTDDPARKPPD